MEFLTDDLQSKELKLNKLDELSTFKDKLMKQITINHKQQSVRHPPPSSELDYPPVSNDLREKHHYYQLGANHQQALSHCAGSNLSLSSFSVFNQSTQRWNPDLGPNSGTQSNMSLRFMKSDNKPENASKIGFNELSNNEKYMKRIRL